MAAIKPDSAFAAMAGRHGGDLATARRLFPDAPAPWLELSTGINPVPYPVGAISTGAFTALPAPAEQAALEAAAAKAWGVVDAASVVAAPGTQAILQHLPMLIPARSVGVLGFTYSGHAAAWSGAGRHISEVEKVEDLADFDVAVVVNPNNPDGRIVSLRVLTGLAAKMADNGSVLIVDEAFVEASLGARSLAPFVKNCGALVLRSFGKIHGLAGLRLGFAVAPLPLAARLRQSLGSWAVSGPALEIGARALADTGWIAEARLRLAADCERLDKMLRGARFEIVGGALLFRLARHPGAAARFEALCRLGVLTRPFASKPDLLRFGLPGTPAAWERLEAALAEVCRAMPGSHPG